MSADTSTKTIKVSLKHTGYPVSIGRGLLSRAVTWDELETSRFALVVSDENVARHYLQPLLGALGDRRIVTHVLPPGEDQKNIHNWASICDRLVEENALRDATVIALGGGVIGDLAGFAAATYMRGIRVIQVPTTLLAQVDASVGGKTAVNHPAGKNLIGAFHQPAAVIADIDTLSTLPRREFNAGMAEVLKYGVIRDRPYFDWIADNVEKIIDRDHGVLIEMISRSVRHKADIVELDERESGIRAILNFGHTFGHAIETLTGYAKYLHGEAVAIGMVAAAQLSELRELCAPGIGKQLRGVLENLGLDTRWPAEVTPGEAVDCMSLDKKARETGLRLVLLKRLGEATLDSGSDSHDIVRAIESMATPNH